MTINEVKSIIENPYEVGYKIPQFLIKGLAIADLMVNTRGESKIPAKNK
ncbi:MAG: phage holin family protein [Clostridia bacterium]